jgi:hypothetical protein
MSVTDMFYFKMFGTKIILISVNSSGQLVPNCKILSNDKNCYLQKEKQNT